jgi:alkylated DNA repair dioxygenase AlkB
MAEALSTRYGRPLREISLATYGRRDSVAFHGDRVGRQSGIPWWPSSRLGAPRRFLLRRRRRGRRAFDLGWGDLLVMGGTCQRTWSRGAEDGKREARMSVQFRPEVPEGTA